MSQFALRPFQEEDVRQIWCFRGRALVASEMGTGKTVTALSWISRIPKRRPALIITPASLKWMWESEAWLKFKIRARVLEGTEPKIKRLEDEVIVVNYDILHAWRKIILRNPPEVVVMDECHYVKTPSARRTKAANSICEGASSVLGLSGTPMTNHPIDLWSVLHLIRPDIFPVHWDFAKRYCHPKKTYWGWKFDGAERKQELFSILRRECMIRRLKKDVAPEIPDKIHIDIPLRTGKKAMDEYEKAKYDFLVWLREKSPGKARKAESAERLVKVGYLFRLCSELKMDIMIKFMKDLAESNPGEKIVCLSGRTFVIDRLQKAFPNSVTVDGRVTGRLRSAAVRKFTNSSKITWFFGNWKAAGTGLNLQKSHIFISLDPPWTPGDLLQGQDRVHRIGQAMKVLIYHLFLVGTIEEDWMNILRERMGDLNDVLNGEAQGTDDAFEQLLDGMLAIKKK